MTVELSVFEPVSVGLIMVNGDPMLLDFEYNKNNHKVYITKQHVNV